MRTNHNTTRHITRADRAYHACATLGMLLTPALIIGGAWEIAGVLL